MKEYNEQLLTQLSEYNKPILMTEGKTDVVILKEAWGRLYDAECPFDIKSCDVFSDKINITAAGCDMLEMTLKSWRHDASNLLIGLFDNDEEGLKSYELDKNFDMVQQKNWKKHKNGMAYAMLLPEIMGREDFVKFKNLCIEFYFELEDLKKEVGGRRLELYAEDIVERQGNKIIGRKNQILTPNCIYINHKRVQRLGLQKKWFQL